MISRLKGLYVIVSLITATTAALVYIGAGRQADAAGGVFVKQTMTEIVSIDARLVQDKVLKGSDGTVSVALNLSAIELPVAEKEQEPVDLLVVLDRSGSMSGQKIHDAQQAVLGLMHQLTPDDRLGLIAYEDSVQTLSPLVSMNNGNRERLAAILSAMHTGNGTNLGGGLQRGVDLFRQAAPGGRQRKLLLISDGLANQGVTDPVMLGAMAANGLEYRFTVSTVGVGYDFNEMLMTSLADHGAGSYYFLENPKYFSAIFQKEFNTARCVAASGLELRLSLNDGVRLIAAGGYPIATEGNTAIVHPGDLLSGQDRTLFLTYRIPTAAIGDFSLGRMEIRYQHNGLGLVKTCDRDLTVACVPDPGAVTASIDARVWEQKVIKEEYSLLKEAVAEEIRQGKKEKALHRINEYRKRNSELNQIMASPEVSKNLDKDAVALLEAVNHTFSGTAADIDQKKKQQSKTLQFEGYQDRRDKKK